MREMARKGEDALQDLREKLKALSNRYAVELLEVLNPKAGDIIPDMGWVDIVEGILECRAGLDRTGPTRRREVNTRQNTRS